MAEVMEDTFGDMLYKDPRNEDLIHLPSPLDLKYKILVKGKKLKKELEEGEEEGEVSDEDEAADISDDLKVSCMA